MDDWQFWAATLLVAAVVGSALWRVRPRRRRSTRVRLTIAGERSDRHSN